MEIILKMVQLILKVSAIVPPIRQSKVQTSDNVIGHHPLPAHLPKEEPKSYASGCVSFDPQRRA